MTDQEKTCRKSPWRFLFAALAAYGAAELLGNLVGWLLYLLLPDPHFTAGEAATIGIIGGADGPTAVFVTGVTTTVPDLTQWILPMLLLGVGIWGYLRLKKGRQK